MNRTIGGPFAGSGIRAADIFFLSKWDGGGGGGEVCLLETRLVWEHSKKDTARSCQGAEKEQK